MEVSLVIPGEPQGKARPRVVKNKYTGRSVSYTPAKTAAYEKLVRAEYIKAAPMIKFDGPVMVTIRAYLGIPESKSKKAKAQMQSGAILPTKKPDCDNIAKIVCDALNGLAYNDDSQITKLVVAKFYDNKPHVRVLIEED